MNIIHTDANRLQHRFTGSFQKDNASIPYLCVTEEVIFADREGKRGSLFSYSYFRTDTPDAAQRPVIFAYNGGPGSSSVWLHMGFFGPRRVKSNDPISPNPTPPFELEDNPHCLLDACDIVIIDPIGTGFGVVSEGDGPSEFLSAEGDALSIALFMEYWLDQNKRWNSPKYIAGESYGTLRSCYLSGTLFGGPMYAGRRLMGINIDGFIMIGTAFGTGAFPPVPSVEPLVIQLASLAATHYYHAGLTSPSIEQFVEEAHRFAYRDYVQALFAGRMLSDSERTSLHRRLHDLTGIPGEVWQQHQLRLPASVFASLYSPGEKLGMYDSRFKMPHLSGLPASAYDPVADDGAMGQYSPGYVAALQMLLRDEMGVELARPYRAIDFALNQRWQYTSSRTPLESLQTAMHRNSELRLFFATGYYDLVTPIGNVRHLMQHSDLPADRVIVKEYASGHMPYVGEESARKFADDLRRFIM